MSNSLRALVVLLLLGLTGVRAAEPESPVPKDDPEKAAKRWRQGAGFRTGVWKVQDLTEVSGARDSETPILEAYYQKGLDRRIGLESSVALWRREMEIEGPPGPLGNPQRESETSYVVPLVTAGKFYLIKEPRRFDPFLCAGLGLTLGLDKKEGNGSDFLGTGSGNGSTLLTGFGFHTGAGFETRSKGGLGLAGGVRYRWNYFDQELAGSRTYRGFSAEVGLHYRFQYD